MERNENLELKALSPVEQLVDMEPVDFYPKKAVSNSWQSYGYGQDEEKFDLREIWRRIFKHKWLILSLVVVITTLVSFYAYRIKPWYTASAVLEVGKDNSIILQSGDISFKNEYDYMVDMNTRMLAFKNPEMFKQVVINEQLDQNPKVLQSFKPEPLFPFLKTADANKSQNSPQVAGPVVPKVALSEVEISPEENKKLMPFAYYVLRGVNVEQVKGTRALKISFTDGDPVLAAQISNGVAAVFKDQSFDNQTENFTTSVNWLDTTTRELKAKVEASEEALAKYTRDNQIYSTVSGNDAKSQTLTTVKMAQLHDQFVKTQTERLLKKSLYDQVVAGRISEVPEAFSDPKINAAQGQLDTLQTQMAELKVKFGPTNPKVQEAQNKIDTLNEQINTSRASLEAKLKAEYERAVQDEQALQVSLNAAKADAVGENQATIKFNILKQDLDTARGLYTDFLQKTNQAKAQKAEQNNNIKVIQAAQVPGGPVGPNRPMIIFTGFILSLGVGIGLAFLIEYLDNTIKSVDDVERYAQLPAIGLIPAMSTSSRFFGNRKAISLLGDGETNPDGNPTQVGLMKRLDNHSIIGESYRALRTSLLLSSAGNPPKTILVTSGRASEGKTTTAVNTAISLAQLGAKVLIIDCDLRRPSMHKKLGISHERGITNYLSSSTELEDLIQELSIPNLSALPCGPIPPNPAELLSSNKMKDMLKNLSATYDHIIIDSPPIINVTDPIILSAMVDGTILVIQSGKTTRDIVQRSRQELQGVRSKIFGVILNNVNLKRDGYGYYNYRYSQEYRADTDAVSYN